MEKPEYTPLNERATKAVENFQPPSELVAHRMAHFAHVAPRPDNKEGNTEVLDGVTFTHHFVDAPGDAETVLWHYVECGQGELVPHHP
jgi:hypothetical protein